MKKLLPLLAVALLFGLVSYNLFLHGAIPKVVEVGPADQGLVWLKRDFALTPSQYEKVLALHQSYQPVCRSHGSRYANAQQRLAGLLDQQDGWTPELAAAIAERARVQGECQGSVLNFAHEVAAYLPPDQRRRYVDLIRTHVVDGRDGVVAAR